MTWNRPLSDSEMINVRSARCHRYTTIPPNPLPNDSVTVWNSDISKWIGRQIIPNDVLGLQAQIVGTVNTVVPKSNYTALVNPTVNDGEFLGYGIGSLWVNFATEQAYIAVRVNSGNALWKLIG